MMEESLPGELGLSSLGHGHHKSRGAVRLPRTVYATLVHTFYPALRHMSTRLASLDVPLTHRPRRVGAETSSLRAAPILPDRNG